MTYQSPVQIKAERRGDACVATASLTLGPSNGHATIKLESISTLTEAITLRKKMQAIADPDIHPDLRRDREGHRRCDRPADRAHIPTPTKLWHAGIRVLYAHGVSLPEPTCLLVKAYDDRNCTTWTVAHPRCLTIIVPDHHDNRGRTRRCGHTGNHTECTGTDISASGNKSGYASGRRNGSGDYHQLHTALGRMAVCGLWDCHVCNLSRAFPFVVIEFVVSESDKSVDTFGCTSIVLGICSSLLLSARNSRRQLEIDLCCRTD